MASAKHFITDRERLVKDSLEAITLVNPAVNLDREHQILYLNSIPDGQICLISGGGSGHEPAFAGFVGEGFLSATVAGSVFASPSARQIKQALSVHNHGRGVLAIVMNYTGDVLNFGLAIEQAALEGTKTRLVIVADDVGIDPSKIQKVGARGIAGTVLVQKIAGAYAVTSASLEDVEKLASHVAANIRSIGVSLEHVHVPGSDAQESILKAGEVEIGMGIHNEPGAEVSKQDLDDLVRRMTEAVCTDKGSKASLKRGAECILLVNNLGGLSNLEFGAIVTSVVRELEHGFEIRPKRVVAGTFMTSLNGQGFSISLLRCDTQPPVDVSLVDLLDATTNAIGWPSSVKRSSNLSVEEEQTQRPKTKSKSELHGVLKLDSRTRNAVIRGCQRVIDAEPQITKYDTVLGDGDCGDVLKRGATAVRDAVKEKDLWQEADLLLIKVAVCVESSMDGTSGGLYGIFLNAMATAVRATRKSDDRDMEVEDWTLALETALERLEKYTGARPGDRTLMDCLYPFVTTLKENKDFSKAVDAAVKGAESTKGMKPQFGRSVYIGGDKYKEIPDAGAYGLSQLLEGLREGLEQGSGANLSS